MVKDLPGNNGLQQPLLLVFEKYAAKLFRTGLELQ